MAGTVKKKRQVPNSSTQNENKLTSTRSNWLSEFVWWLLVLLTAIILWIGNGIYLSRLFENDRHFSHLADFEREMSYRTEMGLYFSYYKTIVSAPSFLDGLYKIMHDNVTEYGHTINTLQRFNLYPELFLSFGYRNFKKIAEILGTDWRKFEICWQVNRGSDLSPVTSCEGVGNLHYFYVYTVFGLAGSVLTSVFLTGVIISGSYFGGLISAFAYIFNLGEATRVQWTPPLRESFAYPVFIAQICLLSYILKDNKICKRIPFISFTILTIISLLFWQFSQFALATQLGSLFIVYTLEFISESTMKALVKSFMISFALSYALLFGNTMLLSSLFFSSIISIIIIMQIRVMLVKLKFRPLFILLHFLLFAMGVFGVKLIIGKTLNIRDDDHVFDLLRSKFTDFANFHTRLYTCAPEFDFIATETIWKLTYTLLLPISGSAVLLIIVYLFKYEFNIYSTFFWRENIDKPKQLGEAIYNAVQLVCFCLMAILIMRLKLFSTPHLCIISALIVNENLLFFVFKRRFASIWRSAFAVAIISAMAYQGVKNVQQQLRVIGEYSNPDQEMLFEWIKSNTKPTAVFAGSMPVMANVKLSTERTIVNHPHYEHEEIRNRTLKVYSLYSRKPIDEVYQIIKEMGVNYYIFQPQNCQNNPRKGCSYVEMWDLVDPENINNKKLCDIIFDSLQNNRPSIIKPFEAVYNSRSYIIFKL